MLLKELGFNAVNLDGGYLTWSNSPAANTNKEREYVS
jgi:rhodanese-related sulfurtransferase